MSITIPISALVTIIPLLEFYLFMALEGALLYGIIWALKEFQKDRLHPGWEKYEPGDLGFAAFLTMCFVLVMLAGLTVAGFLVWS